MTTQQWLASKDPKYRDEAAALLRRIKKTAGKAETSVDRHSIFGFGRGSDGYAKLALAVRKDGLRLYANIFVLAKHKAALGEALTGKSCVTLKRAADIDDKLLARLVTASLAAPALCEK